MVKIVNEYNYFLYKIRFFQHFFGLEDMNIIICYIKYDGENFP